MPKGFDINALLNSMQTSNESANQAGLERYQGLLSSVEDTGATVSGLYGKALGLAGNLGTTGRRDIENRATQEAAATDQDLTSRGLGQTTIRQSAIRDVSDRAMQNKQRLNESVAGMQAGILGQQAGAEGAQGNLMANAILSRQDQTIDPGIYASLIQQLMASGGQMAGGGNATGGGVAPRITGASASGGGGGGGGRSSSSGKARPSSGGGSGGSSHARLIGRYGDKTPAIERPGGDGHAGLVRNTSGVTTTGGAYNPGGGSSSSGGFDRPTRYVPMGMPVPTGAEIARSGAVGNWYYV